MCLTWSSKGSKTFALIDVLVRSCQYQAAWFRYLDSCSRLVGDDGRNSWSNRKILEVVGNSHVPVRTCWGSEVYIIGLTVVYDKSSIAEIICFYILMLRQGGDGIRLYGLSRSATLGHMAFTFCVCDTHNVSTTYGVPTKQKHLFIILASTCCPDVYSGNMRAFIRLQS